MNWLLTDDEYKRRFGELLVRARAPEDFLTPGLVLGALGRGLWGAIRGGR